MYACCDINLKGIEDDKIIDDKLFIGKAVWITKLNKIN